MIWCNEKLDGRLEIVLACSCQEAKLMPMSSRGRLDVRIALTMYVQKLNFSILRATCRFSTGVAGYLCALGGGALAVD